MDVNRPKLTITQKRYVGETSVVSVRLPKDMVKDLDSVAEATGRTRNEIIQMCLEYALTNMEITK